MSGCDGTNPRHHWFGDSLLTLTDKHANTPDEDAEVEAPRLGKSSANGLRPDRYAHASHADEDGAFMSVHLRGRRPAACQKQPTSAADTENRSWSTGQLKTELKGRSLGLSMEGYWNWRGAHTSVLSGVKAAQL